MLKVGWYYKGFLDGPLFPDLEVDTFMPFLGYNGPPLCAAQFFRACFGNPVFFCEFPWNGLHFGDRLGFPRGLYARRFNKGELPFTPFHPLGFGAKFDEEEGRSHLGKCFSSSLFFLSSRDEQGGEEYHHKRGGIINVGAPI